MDSMNREQEDFVMQEEAGQAPIPGEVDDQPTPRVQPSPRIDIAWRIEGDDPGHYLDLEASIAKFRHLAAKALQREGITVDQLPLVIMAEPFLEIRGRIDNPDLRRGYDVVSTIWEQGEWKVGTEQPSQDAD